MPDVARSSIGTGSAVAPDAHPTKSTAAGAAALTFIEDHARLASAAPVNAMTVDVEDYFHVAAFENQINRADWDDYPCRIPRNVDLILETFDRYRVRATFFTLGWVARRYPELVRRIADNGHEVASHGMVHQRAIQQSRQEFLADVTESRALLEDTAGQAVRGYRAPSYSIDARNIWALDVLNDAGYRYSSSIYPISHDLYGMPDAPRFAFRTRTDGLLEIPVTTVPAFGRNWPCGGGGFFRLLPYAVSRWALRRVNTRDRQPGMFYFHPWELDPDQPRVPGASARSRFRHYLNLHHMNRRLEHLLQDFRWNRMDAVFLPSGDDDARRA